jgi:hypothetical protein
MASDAGFHDLELIMDHNVVRALSSSVPSLPNAAYNSASDHLPSQEETVSQDEVFETPHPRAAAAAVSHHFPAGVASISLALGSVLSSSLVLTNSNRVLQAAASSSRGSSAQGSSAVFVSKAPPAAAVPSAKNSHNPLPVVASSQIQVGFLSLHLFGHGCFFSLFLSGISAMSRCLTVSPRLICCSGSHWIGKIARFAIRSNGFSILSQHDLLLERAVSCVNNFPASRLGRSKLCALLFTGRNFFQFPAL